MEKVTIKLENCYWIRYLKHEFDFTEHPCIAIYAPNGAMKTSFAKTFADLSKGEKTSDLMYPARQNIRDILTEAWTPMPPNAVYVIKSYSNPFPDWKANSKLLANSDLRKRHEQIHLKINERKDELFWRLSELSWVSRKKIEDEVFRSFNTRDVFSWIEIMNVWLLNEWEGSWWKFWKLDYETIINEKTWWFFETKDFKFQIRKYIEKYSELLSGSRYLKEWFDHYKALEVQKSLATNNFFSANHSVNLFDGTKNHEIRDPQELFLLIEAEKNSVLEDLKFSKEWKEIDDNLNGHANLRRLRNYLNEKPELLPLLWNPKVFREGIWKSYLAESIDLYKILSTTVFNGSKELAEIWKIAREWTAQWQKVIKDFHERFHVPFSLKVVNMEDAVIKGDYPAIQFIFEDKKDEPSHPEQERLLEVLSWWEKRALYLLDILFEIEELKRKTGEYLIIIDDIADSFDYQNKYAIIQYLDEITKNWSKFKSIILTHNFDFLRTISSRGIVKANKCLCSLKKSNEVSLVQMGANYVKSPFEWWKSFANPNKKNFLATLPFLRNLAWYADKDWEDYENLTAVLHIKNRSLWLKVQDFQDIYELYMNARTYPADLSDEPIISLIISTATECLNDPDWVNLEQKIILSMAIRLQAEMYAIWKINDSLFMAGITSDQTRAVVNEFERKFPNEIENMWTLKEVAMMTPENIHLNSFMYEPILDMSYDHLKKLYWKVVAL